MYPVLFNLGPLPISSFGVLFVAGYIAGVFYIFKKAREDTVFLGANIREETIFDLVIVTSILALLGARSFYIMTHLSDFGLDPLRWVLFTYFPGLVLMGAILTVLLFFLALAKFKKYPFFALADLASMGFLLGAPFGFMGSLLGEKVSYFPIQIIQAMVSLSLFILLTILKNKRVIRRDGILALTFLCIFAIVTFTLEFWRFDKIQFVLLSFRQLLSLILILILLILLVNINQKKIITILRQHKLIW